MEGFPKFKLEFMCAPVMIYITRKIYLKVFTVFNNYMSVLKNMKLQACYIFVACPVVAN